MTPISERQRACFYIYKKQKKCETFIYIYKKPDTFQKAGKFPVCFYPQKDRHFNLRDFSWKFWNWHIYIYKAWNFALRDVFIYKNPDTSQKEIQFALRFFICKNPDTLRYTIFHGIFEIGRRGGGIFIHKNKSLCVKFL